MVRTYADVDYCEWFNPCTETFGLANAHRLKKTKITTRQEWVHGRAKLCQVHHDYAELGARDEPASHDRMWRLINRCMENAGRFIPRQDDGLRTVDVQIDATT